MEQDFNFIKPYLRGWLLILGAMVAAYLIADKYLSYVVPMYESTAKLRLADMNEGVPNSNLFKDLDVFANNQKINAEIELIKSHAILKKALLKVPFETQIFRQGSIKKTELFHDSPVLVSPVNFDEIDKDKIFHLNVLNRETFEILSPKGKKYLGQMNDTLQIENSLILISLNEKLLASKPNSTIIDKYEFIVNSTNRQLEEISKNLDIIAVDKDVPVIRISYKSSHPEKAATLPNALAEAYIEDYIQTKFSAANTTVDFLNERIAEIQKKLSQSEYAVQDYRDTESITNIRQETETDLRKISQLKIQQTNLKMSLDAIKELEMYIESGKDNFLDLASNFEAFTDLLSTELVKKIKQLQSDREDLLIIYTEKDERVKVIDTKIKTLTSYLRESIKNTRKNLEVKYEKLIYDIEEAEKVFIDVPEKERMLNILNRDFEIYQQSYNFLNQKKIEAEIAKAARVAFHRIITPAEVTKAPISPNKTIIKLVSLILGMIFAILLIGIVHSLKAKVNDIASVSSNSLIPILTSVPKLSPKEKQDFFIKTLSEWEVRELFEPQGITCFNGFADTEGMNFISEEITSILELQKRKTLLIRLVKNIAESITDFYTEIPSNSTIHTIHLAEDKLKFLSTEQIQQFIEKKSIGFEQTLIVNAPLSSPFALSIMAVANLNLVCIDTRLTPIKKLIQVDLLKEEYKLENTFFVVNRVGYNPLFFIQIFKFIWKSLCRIPKFFKR